MELNDFETGYPRMKLEHVLDVARVVVNDLHGEEPAEHILSSDLRNGQGKAKLIEKGKQVSGRVGNKVSWRALSGHLHRLRRLQVFDSAQPLNYDNLLKPGSVNIFDLSDYRLAGRQQPRDRRRAARRAGPPGRGLPPA